MATIRRFEDLECWQEARIFVSRIYDLTAKADFNKDFELKNQIKRSAISIMANIAEGFHRNSTKDFMKFLDYSRSSLAESLSHCYVALDQKYISKEEMDSISAQIEVMGKKINRLVKYLNSLT